MLPPKANVDKAKAAATKALQSDDSLAEVHTAQGRVLQHCDWDWLGAEREFKRALELNPNYAEAHHMYSHYLTPMGRIKESLSEAKRALELDPLDVLLNIHLAFANLYAREYDAAIEQSRKAIGMDPNIEAAHTGLGRAYLGKRRYADAITEFQKTITLSGGTAIAPRTWIGYTHAVSGNKADALEILNTLKEEYEQGKNVSPYDLAIIYAGLGQKNDALAWLQKAYEERSGGLLLLKVDAIFDSLKSEPRFQNLLARIGLPL